MRSKDVWFGLPYDTIFFTKLTKYIAKRDSVPYGTYTHTVVSLHVYERNYADIEEAAVTIPTVQISVDFEKLMQYKFILEHIVETSDNPKIDLVLTCEDYGILKEETYEN